MKKLFLGASVLVGISLLPIHSFAASFDCGKSSSTTEKLICSDESLSKLDERLANSYKQALDSATDKESFKKMQIEWLKQQRSCKDVECLAQIYKDRIGVLSGAKTTSETSKASNHEVKKPFADRFDFKKLTIDESESHNPKLCQAFLNYLKYEYRKGECLPPASSKDGEIKFPSFTPIDIAPFEAQDLARVPFEYRDKERQLRMVARIKDIYKRKERIAWVTKFDIDNDGKSEDIFYSQMIDLDFPKTCTLVGGGVEILNGKVYDYAERKTQFGGIPFTHGGVNYLGNQDEVYVTVKNNDFPVEYGREESNGAYSTGRVCVYAIEK